MPRFEPFTGTRYDASRVDVGSVTAPPYDVIDPDELQRLEARSPYNVVHVDLSRDEPDVDRYTAARRRLEAWRADGVLVEDSAPAFYLYRMGWHDEGRRRETSGVIGALELAVPGVGDVLPHERTLPKAKSDRLALQRATGFNLSPVWGLSLAPDLTSRCAPVGQPLASCVDDDGVDHELWRVTDAARIDAISGAVSAAPVVIADGHHRYETALAYRDELRSRIADGAPDADLLMAYIVQLAEDQLDVRPINRLLSGLPAGADVGQALAPWFEVVGNEPAASGAPARRLRDRMAEAGAMALVEPRRVRLLRPVAGAFVASTDELELDLDAARLDRALAALPPHRLWFHHDDETVLSLVEKGEAQVGFLVRPATVAQIASAARQRRRMPEKSTFFSPKPRTGLVLRRLSVS